MQTERERKVQDRTLRIVRKYGGYIYKNAQNIYTEKGRPDLAACIPTNLNTIIKLIDEGFLTKDIGLFVGIELKREGHLSEVSEAQQIVGKKIKKAKGIWLAIDDTDVIELLCQKLTGGIINDEV